MDLTYIILQYKIPILVIGIIISYIIGFFQLSKLGGESCILAVYSLMTRNANGEDLTGLSPIEVGTPNGLIFPDFIQENVTKIMYYLSIRILILVPFIFILCGIMIGLLLT